MGMKQIGGTEASGAAGHAALTARRIAGGAGWEVSDVVCRAGPQDRPFEERHGRMSIAAVVEGSFLYRAPAGRALLYPGAVLLGNAGSCFECGHEHGTGDRCIAFHFSTELFEEIAVAVTGSSRFRFPASMLPADPRLAAPLVDAATAMRGGSQAEREEATLRLAETVLAFLSDGPLSAPAPSSRDERRISDALRHIEAHAEQPIELDELATVAHMSKYHFLRTFRRVAGVTPYQYLLDLRLRRAAVRLRTGGDSVSAVAFDAGFGDLSTFNFRFRQVFGTSPSAFRRARLPERAQNR